MLSVTLASALMIGVTGVLFAVLWLRTRESGMSWLALGSVLTALWYVFGAALPGAGPLIEIRAEQLWSADIAAGVLCLAWGLMLYLGLPQGRGFRLLYLPLLPALVVVPLLLAGVATSLLLFQVVVMLCYVPPAVLAWVRARQSPGEGHGVLALTLVLMVLLPWILVATGTPPAQLKYYTGIAGAVMRMVVLVVCLLRRDRALTVEVARRAAAESRALDANVRLEARVAERTAHLNDLVQGLEFFNRGVSHDLRGPLGGMAVLARLAVGQLRKGEADRAARALQAIADQCDASVQMVASMLELARIDRGGVQRQRIDLCAVARDALEEVKLGYVSRGDPGPAPALRCADMPPVMAEPRLLRTVFVNLIGNAAKFAATASEAAAIQVRAERRGAEFVVSVEDNGPGFGDTQIDRLFEPFYRGDQAARPGHGLGLAIARRAVEAMGGRIWAEPPAGGGAVISFSLPDAVSGTLPDEGEPHGEVALSAR